MNTPGTHPVLAMETIKDPLFKPCLASDLMTREGNYNLRKICHFLGIGTLEFARLVDRRAESVASLVERDDVKPQDERIERVVQELWQIVGLLLAMGAEESAAEWMNTPLPSFNGQTPLNVITEGYGRDLIAQLLALSTGNVSF